MFDSRHIDSGNDSSFGEEPEISQLYSSFPDGNSPDLYQELSALSCSLELLQTEDLFRAADQGLFSSSAAIHDNRMTADQLGGLRLSVLFEELLSSGSARKIRDHLSIAFHSSRIVANMLRFRNEARNIRDQFSVATEARGPHYKHISRIGVLVKGELGGVQYDLAQPPTRRRNCQLLSAKALNVVSVVDYFLDETPLPTVDQIDLVQKMLSAITEGKEYKFGHAQLDKTVKQCQELHACISALPSGDAFFNKFSDLAEAAIKQVEGASSLELASKIGASTVGLSAVIPYCFDRDIDLKFLNAAEHFGSYVQIMDDIQDFEHDLRRGLKTPITAAEETEIAIEHAKEVAKAHYCACLSFLSDRHQNVYRSLVLLGGLVWKLRI
jgi:hypothetical protein